MVFRSHPIGACCVRSGRLQGFIPQELTHFEEHILTLHTVRSYVSLYRRGAPGPVLAKLGHSNSAKGDQMHHHSHAARRSCHGMPFLHQLENKFTSDTTGS
jgi:hypothetical protein